MGQKRETRYAQTGWARHGGKEQDALPGVEVTLAERGTKFLRAGSEDAPGEIRTREEGDGR